jgi:hypothetical protein
MTAALGILERLTAAGVTLDLDDGDILYRGPRATLTTKVLEELASCKADVVVELHRWSTKEPCCPADIFERGACLIEGTGSQPHEADARALAEHGFASWAMLAQAHRTHILAKLHGLPPSDGACVQRLVRTTRAFLNTNHWHEAIRAGWTMIELFGVLPNAPVLRVDGHGLVPSIALSQLPGGEIVSIENHGAVMQFRSGSRLTFYRGKPAIDHAVPWWACEEITGRADGTRRTTTAGVHACVPIGVSGQ